jgi:hypothetical protein
VVAPFQAEAEVVRMLVPEAQEDRLGASLAPEVTLPLTWLVVQGLFLAFETVHRPLETALRWAEGWLPP